MLFWLMLMVTIIGRKHLELKKNDEEGGELSSISTDGSTVTDANNGCFCFTGEARGSTRCGGWSSDGVKFYNIMLDLILFQREQPGGIFDKLGLEDLVNQKSSGRNRGRRQASGFV